MKLPTPKERKEAHTRFLEIEKNKEKEKFEQEAKKLKELETRFRPNIEQIKQKAREKVLEASSEKENECTIHVGHYSSFANKKATEELKAENPDYSIEYGPMMIVEYHHNDMHYSKDRVQFHGWGIKISWKNP